ncbi:MAG TPA: MYXO-CTERM sorting domain-containing protein [Polyangiaceae bacterium]
MENRRHRSGTFLLRAVLLLACLLVGSPALGAGRVEWKTKSLEERDNKSWRIEITVYLPKAPDTAYVPMKFEFQPTAYYERAMTDGDKLVERTVPLEHQQSMIETVDVGFLDPGTAKIQSRTKFSFKVTRAQDYHAGEYKVTIFDVRNNQKIGAPVNIKLLGENEIIDRRAITFSGEKKKKKTDEKKDEAAEGEGAEGEGAEGEASDEGAQETEQMDLQNTDDEELENEGEIKEKPGGCGCRMAGTQAPPQALLGLLLLGAAVWSRRRR